MEQRKAEYESKIKEFSNLIEKEFKNSILKSAENAYIEDKIKKVKLKRYKLKINSFI